jgi:hypothetical protein
LADGLEELVADPHLWLEDLADTGLRDVTVAYRVCSKAVVIPVRLLERHRVAMIETEVDAGVVQLPTATTAYGAGIVWTLQGPQAIDAGVQRSAVHPGFGTTTVEFPDHPLASPSTGSCHDIIAGPTLAPVTALDMSADLIDQSAPSLRDHGLAEALPVGLIAIAGFELGEAGDVEVAAGPGQVVSIGSPTFALPGIAVQRCGPWVVTPLPVASHIKAFRTGLGTHEVDEGALFLRDTTACAATLALFAEAGPRTGCVAGDTLFHAALEECLASRRVHRGEIAGAGCRTSSAGFGKFGQSAGPEVGVPTKGLAGRIDGGFAGDALFNRTTVLSGAVNEALPLSYRDTG